MLCVTNGEHVKNIESRRMTTVCPGPSRDSNVDYAAFCCPQSSNSHSPAKELGKQSFVYFLFHDIMFKIFFK